MSNFHNELSTLEGRRCMSMFSCLPQCLAQCSKSTYYIVHIEYCLIMKYSKAESEPRRHLSYTSRFNLAEDVVRSPWSPDSG